MHEVKSVKVDNWGVFFLQKLQNFFNKTDYCDLTLQFKDNSQLKVHRLVLSACTDFFNVLEQRYNVTDDILTMPKDLQADVVVPIVNFMYTGTLEFEMHMYARLLKTAKDMNMTVLLKLLEAHKRTVAESNRSNAGSQGAPVLLNKGANQRINTYSRPSTSPAGIQRTYTPRRPIVVSKTTPPKQQFNPVITKIKTEKSDKPGDARNVDVVRNLPSTSYLRKNLPEPVQLVAKYANSSAVSSGRGPSRFECVDDTNLQDTFESSFDNISYESKPLITASQVCKEEKDLDYDSTSSSFEQLKRSYTGTTKRAYSGSSTLSPPEKKPNIQDVKEYTEAHRLRKEIVAEEFENEPEYFGDDFQGSNDDDEEEYITGELNPKSSQSPGGSVIIKSDSGSPVNHAKIISEVLKKYPHLVKNNKNIKLKIMQKGNSGITTSTAAAKDVPVKQTVARLPATAVAKKALPQKTVAAPTPASNPAPTNQPKKIDSRTMHALIAKGAENMTGPWLCLDCGVNGRPISIPSYKGFRRHLINVHRQKIDTRLCEHCGWRSSKRIDLHHHILVKHNIKPPQDLQYPKCGLCLFIAVDHAELRKHKEEDHQNQSSQQHCIYCNKTFSKEIVLYAHMRSDHKERAQEDGVMDFSDEETYEDDADKYVPNHPELGLGNTSSTSDNKIKVLSNIALPNKSTFVLDTSNAGAIISTENLNLEPSSEAEGLSNVASGIATSLGVLDTSAHTEEEAEAYRTEEDPNDIASNQYIEAEMANVHGELIPPKKEEEEGTEVVTKFITEEGSELQLTAAQKAELLEQLQGQGDGITDNVVMVLNDGGFEQLVYGDQQQQPETDQKPNIVADDSAETAVTTQNDSMEWQEAPESEEDDHSVAETSKNEESQAENEHTDADTSAENLENIRACITKDDSIDDEEADDDVKLESENENDSKKEAKPSQLISALEGDWTDDDEEDESNVNAKESALELKEDEEKLDGTVLVSTVTRSVGPISKSAKTQPKIVDDSYDSSSNSSTHTAKKDSATKLTDKSVSNLLLDDWNDSQQSEKFDAASDDGAADSPAKEEAMDVKKETVEQKILEDNEKSSKDSATNKIEKKSKVTEEKSTESDSASNNGKSSSSKAEIKTLINDWGDEDDEDDAY